MNQKIRTFSNNLINDKVFLASMVALVATAVLAIIANLTVSFHIRNVEIVGGSKSAELVNQRVRIEFNRPLAKDFRQEQLKIMPAAKFKTIVAGASLFVYFEQPLTSSQQYTLSFSQDTKDIYGEVLAGNKDLIFEARQMHLAYVQKEPTGFSLQSWSPQNDRSTLITESSQKIIDYAINDEYAVIIQEKTEFVNQLNVVNRRSGQSQIATLENLESTYRVEFLPGENQVLVTKEKVRYEQGYAVSDGGRKLFLLDLGSMNWREIDLKLGIEDIDVFNLSSDGGAVLVRDSANAQYYLIDVSDPSRNFPLGRFVGGGDIDFQNKEVIFTKLDPLSQDVFPYIVQVNSEGKETQLSPKNGHAIDPEFMNSQSGTIWSQRYQAAKGTQGLFEIVQVVETGQEKQMYTYRVPEHSLELGTVSIDDQYLAAEKYTLENLRSLEGIRVIGFQSKPANADVLVFKVGETKELKMLAGATQPTWY